MTTVYDGNGSPVASVNPLGDRVTTLYDSLGRETAVIDPNNNRTTSVYDASGLLTATIDALGNRTTNLFDSASRRMAFIDPRGNRTSFAYDNIGNRISITNPLSQIVTSGFNANSQQTLRIDARGNRTSYTYDGNGLETLRQYPDGSRVTQMFDANGNRTVMADATGRYTWTYDARNTTLTATNPQNKTLTYSYDSLGQRQTLIDPDSGRTTYAYDADGRITLVHNPDNERTSFSYDAASRRTLKKLANGTRTSFNYDANDQMTSVAHLNSSASIFSNYDYTYDSAGNRTAVLEHSGDRVTYSYDNTYQLTAEHRSGTNSYSHTYTYDANGNRLVKQSGTSRTTSIYDAANRLTTSENATGTTTYTYDADGNQTTVTDPANSITSFSWDYENENTLTELPDTSRVTQTYNGDLIVIERKDSAGTTRFIWDEDNISQETDGSNITQTHYDYAPSGFGELVTARQSAASLFYHFDALGSTVALTNAADTVTDTTIYDAFGNVISNTGTTDQPFSWIGQSGYYFDSKTGLYILRRRPLNSTTSRFLSQDPIADDEENLYRYVRNEPLNAVDPSGLVYERVPGVILKRNSIKPFAVIGLTKKDAYGHWWIEIDGKESYGYWPKRKINGHKEAINGIPGELNASAFGGSAKKDPHHGDAPDASRLAESYPFSSLKLKYGDLKGTRCCDLFETLPWYILLYRNRKLLSAGVAGIKSCIREGAKSMGKEYKIWKYPGIMNCHTFQDYLLGRCCSFWPG